MHERLERLFQQIKVLLQRKRQELDTLTTTENVQLRRRALGEIKVETESVVLLISSLLFSLDTRERSAE